MSVRIEQADHDAAVLVVEGMTELPALLAKDVIKRDQDGIKRDLDKLDHRIHSNAVQCMMHAKEHGDTSLFRRLLLDTITRDSGYRLQSLIAWMRKWSPMELVGDTIKLTGTMQDGSKRPWRIEEANASPFRSAADMKERPIRPIYRETLLSKVQAAIKEARAAISNTVDGKPVDQTKPFYDGLHADKLLSFVDEMETGVVKLSEYRDNTLALRKSQEALRKAQLDAEEIENDQKAISA